MVFDQGKYYVIIRAVPGQEEYTDDLEYLYGKRLLEDGKETFHSYIKKEKKRVEKVIEQMKLSGLSEEGRKRYQKLEQEKSQLEEVMHRITTEKQC